MMFLFKPSGWLGQNLTGKSTDQSKLVYLLTIIYFDWDRTSKTNLRMMSTSKIQEVSKTIRVFFKGRTTNDVVFQQLDIIYNYLFYPGSNTDL